MDTIENDSDLTEPEEKPLTTIESNSAPRKNKTLLKIFESALCILNKVSNIDENTHFIDDTKYQVTKDESKRRILIILIVLAGIMNSVTVIGVYGLFDLTSMTVLEREAIIISSKHQSSFCSTYIFIGR